MQDLLNETANYAHVFLPGAASLKRTERSSMPRPHSRVRRVMSPNNGYGDWEVTQLLANALGLTWAYSHPSEIMDDRRLTPAFKNVSYRMLEKVGSVQWPCNDASPDGMPIMHVNGFTRGKGRLVIIEYLPTDEKTGPRFPLCLRPGASYECNVGAQTRRTENSRWHEEDVLEIHPHDAEVRGMRDGDWVRVQAGR